jgi:hypothetical protein
MIHFQSIALTHISRICRVHSANSVTPKIEAEGDVTIWHPGDTNNGIAHEVAKLQPRLSFQVTSADCPETPSVS